MNLVDIKDISQPESPPKPLAISQGEPEREQPNAPTSLANALQRAAVQMPHKGIIYLDGSEADEVTQSYAALLAEAERILAGLRNLGLKAQDKVIFQLDRNQDFIPALWGCILGGFVPVPISIAPTYEVVNSTVNKLHNTWQLLNQPPILTNRRQAAAIHSLSNLLGLENFQVETIDDLRACAPDQNWHGSQPDDLAVLLLTSGSTGIPKGVMLSQRNILSNVFSVVQMNRLSREDVSLNWLNLDHVSSLVGCLRAIYVGCQQIHAPAEVVLEDPLRLLDWIEQYQVTCTWAPNFAFSLINNRAEAIKQRRWDLSSVKSVISGSEAIVPKTAKRFWELLAPYGLSINAMHSAWGMSETCAGVTFSHRYLLDLPSDDHPFVEVGAPIPGLAMRIVDAQERVVEEDTIGHLQIKGPMIACGYYQNPQLNTEAFTDDGWLKTGDLGFLHQGRLTITGRQKDVIIINGLNYYSHEIEAVVEEVEGVEVSYTAACAIQDANSNTDQLVIFFHTLLADEGLVELLKQIRRNVVRKIGANPTYLVPVPKQAIPKTSSGKIQRLQLKTRFESGEFDQLQKMPLTATGEINRVQLTATSLRTAELRVAPRTELEQQIAAIWQEVLGVSQVGIHDNFFELGGNSLQAVQLLTQIQKVCRKNLPLATLFQDGTIEQMATVVSQLTNSLPWSPLVAIQPSGSKRPFFCIPGAHGLVIYLDNLARHLGPDQPFYGLQAVGLDGKSAPHTRVENMASHYIQAIQTVQPQGPYLLGGHSFGGLVAFEIAQQLLNQGHEVALLAIVDTKAPVPRHKPIGTDWDDAMWLTNIAKTIERWFGKNLAVSYEALQPLAWDEQLNYFQEQLARSNVLPPGVGASQIHGLVQVFKANYQTHYLPKVYPSKITLFQASEVHPDNAASESEIVEEPAQGWGKFSAQPVEIHVVPGSHITMMAQPHVQVLAARLRASLEQAQADD